MEGEEDANTVGGSVNICQSYVIEIVLEGVDQCWYSDLDDRLQVRI